MKRLTIDEFNKVIINEELKYAGKNYDDVKNVENWFDLYTMTSSEHETWKLFVINLLMKDLKFSKKKSEQQFEWISLSIGLRIDNKTT